MVTDAAFAIIPARAGSKGVPGKNKRIVHGRPLISYSIEAAQAAKLLDGVIVSTDDPEIADICAAENVEIVMRPAAMAQDDSQVVDAVRHALGSRAFQAVVLLQPTSPLRTGADIDAAIRLFRENGKIPICSVCRVEDAHPARMYRISRDRLESLMPELSHVRRQDLPPVYHRNGALYVFGEQEVINRTIITDYMLPYVMPTETSINIDSEMDLLLLETFLAHRHEHTHT